MPLVAASPCDEPWALSDLSGGFRADCVGAAPPSVAARTRGTEQRNRGGPDRLEHECTGRDAASGLAHRRDARVKR